LKCSNGIIQVAAAAAAAVQNAEIVHWFKDAAVSKAIRNQIFYIDFILFHVPGDAVAILMIWPSSYIQTLLLLLLFLST
jgi:hypothetical protein